MDALGVKADAFRDQTVFPLAAGEVSYVRLSDEDQRLELRRKKEGEWFIAEPRNWKADGQVVAELLKRLLALRIEEFSAAADEDPAATGLAATGRAAEAARTIPSAAPAARGMTNRRNRRRPRKASRRCACRSETSLAARGSSSRVPGRKHHPEDLQPRAGGPVGRTL